VGVDSAGREQVHDATCNVPHLAALACWELAVAAVAEGDVMAWVGLDESRCVCVRVRVCVCVCVLVFYFVQVTIFHSMFYHVTFNGCGLTHAYVYIVQVTIILFFVWVNMNVNA